MSYATLAPWTYTSYNPRGSGFLPDPIATCHNLTALRPVVWKPPQLPKWCGETAYCPFHTTPRSLTIMLLPLPIAIQSSPPMIRWSSFFPCICLPITHICQSLPFNSPDLTANIPSRLCFLLTLPSKRSRPSVWAIQWVMFMPSPSSIFNAFFSVFGLSCAREEGRDELVLSTLNP